MTREQRNSLTADYADATDEEFPMSFWSSNIRAIRVIRGCLS